jgi:pantoate--beta-alanine ligase
MDDHRLTIVSNIQVLREEIADLRADKKTVALIPTMGALHEGHLSLIDFAKEHADKAVCSIYVNPTQFAPGEDLNAYPRPLIDDIRALEGKLTDFVFTPTDDEMYPDGFSTKVSVSGVSSPLCGKSRPDHFDGVATIVTKLLMMVQPDFAIFGEKDYQQLLVIRRFVSDLNIPIEILGAPIVRAEDGLALSSRNQYLSTKEREVAPLLNQTLAKLSEEIKTSNGDPSKLITSSINQLTKAGFEVDYLEIRDAKSLAPIIEIFEDQTARLFVAAKLGKTRLIDNIAV